MKNGGAGAWGGVCGGVGYLFMTTSIPLHI